MNTQQAKNTALAIAEKIEQIDNLLEEIAKLNTEYSLWISGVSPENPNPILRGLLSEISSDEFRSVLFTDNPNDIRIEFNSFRDFYDYASEEMQYL